MQVTKGTWRMREQCVPGSLFSSPAQEPGNKANHSVAVISNTDSSILPNISVCDMLDNGPCLLHIE